MLVLFTPKHREILCHRLEVPECLCEVYRDTAPEDIEPPARGTTPQAVYEAAEELLAMLSDDGPRCIDTETTPLTPAHKFALADAVNGSTYLAAARSSGEFSKRRLATILHEGQKLALKIETLTGIPCDYPTH